MAEATKDEKKEGEGGGFFSGLGERLDGIEKWGQGLYEKMGVKDNSYGQAEWLLGMGTSGVKLATNLLFNAPNAFIFTPTYLLYRVAIERDLLRLVEAGLVGTTGAILFGPLAGILAADLVFVLALLESNKYRKATVGALLGGASLGVLGPQLAIIGQLFPALANPIIATATGAGAGIVIGDRGKINAKIDKAIAAGRKRLGLKHKAAPQKSIILGDNAGNNTNIDDSNAAFAGRNDNNDDDGDSDGDAD